MEPLNRPYRNSEEANGESMIPVERQPANSLRTRIAAALYARAIERLGWNRSWDNLGAPSQQLWLDDADAVIRELGLKRADGPLKGTPVHRYITDWIPNE